jgi:D-amino-acid oxidase
VTGLTSALFLAEAGYVVTTIAAHVPGDSSIEYTSPWLVHHATAAFGDIPANKNRRAGAHWLPHSRAHEPVICDWDVQTYDYWLEMIRQEDEDRKLPPSGLKVCTYTSCRTFWG